MAFNFAGLVEPVSADAPCGPDLDLEGDPAYANFIAHAEAILPASFFTRDDEGNVQVFDRTTIDFPAEFKAAEALLAETRDLRLATIYARLFCLNRDLAGFSESLGGIVALLDQRWEEVHPQADGGDFTLRGAILQSLDDTATIVMPLQHIPLVESRRSGAISYRSVMIANGEVAARADEANLDRGTIDKAFADADLDHLTRLRAWLRASLEAAEQIQRISLERAGYEQAVTLEKLPPLLTKMEGYIGSVVSARDPSAAPSATPDGAEPGAPSGQAPAAPAVKARIASLRDAKAAFGAVNRYFRESEPSSPARLLVEQAEALVGKSFVEVIRTLLPDQAREAKVLIGSDKLFGLTLDQLSSSESWSSSESSYSDDSEPSGEPDGGGGEEGAADEGGRAEPAGFEARTRPEALSLMDQVGAYFRAAQPSSPIPLLLERAHHLAERDFSSLLKEVLPDLVRPSSY